MLIEAGRNGRTPLHSFAQEVVKSFPRSSLSKVLMSDGDNINRIDFNCNIQRGTVDAGASQHDLQSSFALGTCSWLLRSVAKT